jgi:predicted transcriptional regulator
MTIKNILGQKGRSVWSISPDATVFDALTKMAKKDVGSLVVMDDDKLIGIITERHYAYPQRQNVPHHARQGHHGEKRNPC